MTTKADVLAAIAAVDDAHSAYVGILRRYLEQRGWRRGEFVGWWHQEHGREFKISEAMAIAMQHDNQEPTDDHES